ncbi:MAG: hypothetical protein AAEI08_01850, partial [Gammaproteobacteria bacterium]
MKIIVGTGLLALSFNMAAAQESTIPGVGFAAVPGQKGGQDITGPYDVVTDWPKDIATLPGHSEWTFGAVRGVFAESPDRVFVLQVSEKPKVERPEPRNMPEVGASSVFPIDRLPWRSGRGPGTVGVDRRVEHAILVFNQEGEIIEEWTQWDHLVRTPHAIHINPYDNEKHIWIVDDQRHAVFKFTNDGKELVQTLGIVDKPGMDENHLSWPTFLAWLPDGTLFVADGGASVFVEGRNARVIKFNESGDYVMQWGSVGKPPNETRPGYFNNVHGIAVDPETRQVFVNDRDNHRIQVFTENGKFLNDWSTGDARTDIHLIIYSPDRALWAVDRNTSKILKYNLNGHLLYSWGTWGAFPGGMWGVHGLDVDQEGNLYTAAVDGARVQKFKPRPGVNPAFLIQKSTQPAWR